MNQMRLRTTIIVSQEIDSSADIITSHFANDTAAINTAITLAVCADKRHVLLCGKEGTIYTIGHGRLLLPSHFTLEAESGVILKMCAPTVNQSNPVAIGNLDILNGNCDITLRNIVGDGNGLEQSPHQPYGGIFLHFTGVHRLRYENVHITQSRRHNSLICARIGEELIGKLTLQQDKDFVRGERTAFLRQLVIGQRLRSQRGHISPPIVEIISDGELLLADPWDASSEPSSSHCKVIDGTIFAAKDSSFGSSFDDTSFAGYGWDEALFINTTIEATEPTLLQASL